MRRACLASLQHLGDTTLRSGADRRSERRHSQGQGGWRLRKGRPRRRLDFQSPARRGALELCGVNSTLPTPDYWEVSGPTIAPLGRDRRFLYSNLPTQNVNSAGAVQDFKQTARTLTGTAVRQLDATTDKASLDVTLANVVEKLKQVAVTINDIPNAIFESVDPMRAYLNSEGQFQVEKALDAHVMSQIVAAAPPFGTTGTGLVAVIRNGIATMRATGANPSIVLNPTDAATLDLEADAGGYIFPTRDSGSSSPLWGHKVVERIGAGTEAPYLIDPQMLGQLYLGNMRFEADPFTGFKKNVTTLRIGRDPVEAQLRAQRPADGRFCVRKASTPPRGGRGSPGGNSSTAKQQASSLATS